MWAILGVMKACPRFALLSLVFLALVPLVTSAADPKTTKIDGVTVSTATAEAIKGGCDYDPFQALRPYISGGNVIPTNVNGALANGIDSALACRLSKFLKYANESVCATKIISGYRSKAHQQAICGAGRSGCAPPGTSCHQPGRAVDLSSDCGGRLRAISRQFNLHFPYRGIHVQCIEHRTAGISSCNRPCDGGLSTTGVDTSTAPPPPSSPSQGISSNLRNALGMSQQPPPPSPMPSQPLASSPTNYFPQNPTNPTTPTTPTIPTTPTTPPTPTTTGTTSTSTGDGFDDMYYVPYEPSIADKLLELAYGTEKGTEEGVTTTRVIADGTDVAVLAGQHSSTTNASTTDGTSIVALEPPNTFISSDLAYYNAAPTSDATGFARALINLEAMIRAILEVLKPMGISAAIANDSTEHVE